jgi:hypothetical protein
MLSQGKALFGQLSGREQSRMREIKPPQAYQGREALGTVAYLLAQLLGSGVRVRHFWGCRPFDQQEWGT